MERFVSYRLVSMYEMHLDDPFLRANNRGDGTMTECISKHVCVH